IANPQNRHPHSQHSPVTMRGAFLINRTGAAGEYYSARPEISNRLQRGIERVNFAIHADFANEAATRSLLYCCKWSKVRVIEEIRPRVYRERSDDLNLAPGRCR